MRVMTWFAFFLFLLAVTCSRSQVIYSGQYGQPVGSSVTVGGATYYSNQYGQPVGTARVQPATPTPPQAAPPLPLFAPASPPQSAAMLPVLPVLPVLPILEGFK